MKETIEFYTNVLNFNLKHPHATADDRVVTLINGDAELGLTSLEGDQKPAINVFVRLDDVDTLFKKYVGRGLAVPNNPDSSVHNDPIDQTWGIREFYVTDPSGNTLRFGQPIERQ